MDSVPLEMDDIFAEHEEEEDDFPAPLPDLPQELEPLDMSIDEVNPSQDTENAEVLARLKDLSKGARKIVKRNVPKLDSARLTGDRGIPILPQVFKDITFKGKGHEAEDLKLVMSKLEHWGHRLFPKMPFDEILERIEKLGCKKEVQTCIKKMRLDMPLLNEDFVMRDEEDDLTAELVASGDTQTNGSATELNQDAETAFDEMMQASGKQTNHIPSTPQTPDPVSVGSELVAPGNVSSTATPLITPRQGSSVTTSSTTATVHDTPVTARESTLSNGLTPDQAERIERNRRLAMEKRNARQRTATGPAQSTQPKVSEQKSAIEDPSTNKSDDGCSSGTLPVNSLSSSQEGTSQPTVSEQRSAVEDPSSKTSDDGSSTGTIPVNGLSSSHEGTSQPTVSEQQSAVEDHSITISDSISAETNSNSNPSSSQKDTFTTAASTVLEASDDLKYQGEDVNSSVQETSGGNEQATMSIVKEQSADISTPSERQAVGGEEQIHDSDPEDAMEISGDGPQQQSSEVLTSDVVLESTLRDPEIESSLRDPDPETESTLQDPEAESTLQGPGPESTLRDPDPETESTLRDPETESTLRDPDPETESTLGDPDPETDNHASITTTDGDGNKKVTKVTESQQEPASIDDKLEDLISETDDVPDSGL